MYFKLYLKQAAGKHIIMAANELHKLALDEKDVKDNLAAVYRNAIVAASVATAVQKHTGADAKRTRRSVRVNTHYFHYHFIFIFWLPGVLRTCISIF